jgi:hypothetical protein
MTSWLLRAALSVLDTGASGSVETAALWGCTWGCSAGSWLVPCYPLSSCSSRCCTSACARRTIAAPNSITHKKTTVRQKAHTSTGMSRVGSWPNPSCPGRGLAWQTAGLHIREAHAWPWPARHGGGHTWGGTRAIWAQRPCWASSAAGATGRGNTPPRWPTTQVVGRSRDSPHPVAFPCPLSQGAGT